MLKKLAIGLALIIIFSGLYFIFYIGFYEARGGPLGEEYTDIEKGFSIRPPVNWNRDFGDEPTVWFVQRENNPFETLSIFVASEPVGEMNLEEYKKSFETAFSEMKIISAEEIMVSDVSAYLLSWDRTTDDGREEDGVTLITVNKQKGYVVEGAGLKENWVPNSNLIKESILSFRTF